MWKIYQPRSDWVVGWGELLSICAEYSKLDRSKWKYSFYTNSDCYGGKKNYDQLFGKPNSGKLRRSTGRALSRTNKSISNSKSQIKKYGAIGAGLYAAKKVTKKL